MSEQEIPIHYVCTQEKAQELINKHNKFWVSNCGCREGKGSCKRSRMDICLFWVEHDQGSGSGKKTATKAEVDAIMKLAKEANLVTRPFRNEARTDTDGVCFCCDCCCGYFEPGNTYTCDKGELIEKTTMDDCTHCGQCETACYFKARIMKDDKLVVERDNCYGCGLCVDACPVGCIELTKRT
jgi:ferredoxin